MAGLNFSKNQQIALIVIVGLALLGITYGRLRASHRPSAESTVTVTETGRSDVDIDAPAVRPSGFQANESSIVVHVVGCVKNPNIYKFTPGSRIADAVQAAGGTTADADLNTVNLAAKLQDGQQVIIPSKNMAIRVTAIPQGRLPRPGL
jgi:competence protein ComEA